MAERTEGSIVIDADPAKVMAAIADYEAYPEWSSEMRSAKILERDDAGRGSKVHFEVSAGPIKAEYTLAYAYHADDAGVSWTFVEGKNLRDLSGEYELQQQGEKTKVTYRLRVDTTIPMLGFMKRQAEKRIIDVALKGLKKRVESG